MDESRGSAPAPGTVIDGLIVEIHFADGDRARLRPISNERAPTWMRVEFPKDLRTGRQAGALFRIRATVAQKHNADGSLRGKPYLVAAPGSIDVL
jgi:hypothetical protein